MSSHLFPSSPHKLARTVSFVTLIASCPADNSGSCGYIGWSEDGPSNGTTSNSSTTTTDVIAETATATTTEVGVPTSGEVPESTGTAAPTSSTATSESTETSEPAECDELMSLADIVGIPETIHAGDSAADKAVFVSIHGHDGNDGGPSTPKFTLAAGVQSAQTMKRSLVLLCTDSESEAISAGSTTVSIPSGISIIGGFQCEPDHEWDFPASGSTTKVDGLTGVGLKFEPSQEPSVLAHLRLEVNALTSSGEALYGEDGSTRNGGSAVGIVVKERKLDVMEVRFTTRPGSPGKNGASLCGTDAGRGGFGPFFDGAKCCSKFQICQSNSGCFDCSHVCPNGTVAANFGFGGLGGVAPNGVGGAGSAGDTPPGGAQGGEGGFANQISDTCVFNGNGERGDDGPPAESDGVWDVKPIPFGSLSIDGFITTAGADGAHGNSGGGGGGGRGAHALAKPQSCNDPDIFIAAPGGNGGSGGCGGSGGIGGGSGGSSLGIISLDADVRIIDSQFTIDDGGHGGDSGCRQLGADGSLGASLENGACRGGDGGRGSDGGFAGGGMGGHSAAIAFAGQRPLMCGTTKNSITLGDAGQGGEPEAAVPIELADSLRGEPGCRASLLDFSQPGLGCTD